MFTAIDKNLLIAAMESAIFHACVNANVVSLHAIETGVSDLRQRFDQNPESVTDDDVFNMVNTIERATIPPLTTIGAIDDDTNIADRVVSYLWRNIVDKPTSFPSSWDNISNKPETMPPTAHTHPAANPLPIGRHLVHSMPNVPNLVLERDGNAQYEEMATLKNIDEKIAAIPPAAPPSQLADIVKIGGLWLRPGQIEGAIDWNWDGGQTWACTFPPAGHGHTYSDIDGQDEMERIFFNNQLSPAIALVPSSCVANVLRYSRWKECNGAAILRESPAGWYLVEGGCQFGAGDGTTTVNLPTLTAPTGFVYMMYIGSY